MKVEIDAQETKYRFSLPGGKVLFKVEEATLRHERFDGTLSRKVKRVNFERGDGVGVLMYSEQTEQILLVEQFRYPAYANIQRNGSGESPWLLEIVAGVKDDNGCAVAQREIMEETGVEHVCPLEHLTTFFVSPGGTSERIELYLARVTLGDDLLEHAGLTSEGEDIKTHLIPFADALQLVADGRIQDGKTIIALYMLNERLRDDGAGI